MNWTQRAMARLGEEGFRAGAARRRVIELLGGESCAIAALEIDRRLPSVGRATVYRTLEQLERLRLVRRVDLGGGGTAFERVDPAGHHHHMVCTQCGSLIAFADRTLERAIEAVGERSEFELSDHDVLLRGRCARCGRAAA